MAAANASLGDLRTWTHHVLCLPLIQWHKISWILHIATVDIEAEVFRKISFVSMGLVIDKVALGQVYIQVHWVFPRQYSVFTFMLLQSTLCNLHSLQRREIKHFTSLENPLCCRFMREFARFTHASKQAAEWSRKDWTERNIVTEASGWIQQDTTDRIRYLVFSLSKISLHQNTNTIVWVCKSS